jgi:hypothetical protein
MTDPFEFVDIELSENTGSVDTAVKEAVKAIEQEPKVEEPIVEIPTEKPVEAPVEDDLNGFSNAALLALSFQKTKGLLPEELEIKKDLSAEELQDLLLEAAEKKLKGDDESYIQKREEEARQLLEAKGMTDAHLTYIQQIINGADPQIVSRVAQYRSWADAELESEEEYEAAIRAGLRLQLNNNPNAEDLIEAYMDKNVKDKDVEILKEHANKFQGYIGQVADYLEEQDNQRVQAERAAQEQQKVQFATDIEKQLQTGFYGIELKKPKQKELHDYMTKETVVVEIGGVKRKVTQEQADIIKDRADMQKRAFEAYQRMTGFNKIANAAHQTAQDKFLKGIKAQEEPTRTNVQLPSKSPMSSDYEYLDI